MPEGEVVAKVGKHKLYSTELSMYIPSGVSPEDSTKLALQYINNWATNMLFIDTAQKELSKDELDVSKELEDYKRSLLKFKYEQKFINQRLDTTISQSQLMDYYNTHIDQFTLDVPIVKARFVSVYKGSQEISDIRKHLSLSGDDYSTGDSLAYTGATRFSDFGGNWVSASVLAREFGTDYKTMLSAMKNGYIEKEDENGNIDMAFVLDIRRPGEVGPVEYFKDRIQDVLLSRRKQELLSDLEQDLLDRARREKNLVIY